jgi:hypothetical protein
MKKTSKTRGVALLGAGACLLGLAAARAAADEPQAPPAGAADIDALRARIAEEAERLQALKRSLQEQEAHLQSLQHALDDQWLGQARGTGPGPADAAGPSAAVAQPAEVAQPAAPARAPAPVPVATESQPAPRKPQVAEIFEQPGILTPRGKMVLDPSFQYSYSSSNRLALVGYTIIPAILIGVIDVREVKRNTTTTTLTARYGLTNRFEVEARLPYVYRTDTSIGREILNGSATDTAFDASGQGIGDVEVSGRYQFNDGGADKPYFIGGLRLKSRTGKDPFEVVTTRNVLGLRDGVQTELPTGSGFYGVQPSLTVLFPSDPAVFFGSLSYLYSVKRENVVRKIDVAPYTEALGTIQPGGVFGFNFGMGLGLNDRASFSIGYDHSSVGRTYQNGQPAADSVRVQLGTLLLGFAYRLNDRQTLNLSLGAGVTTDTPDVTLTLRIPTSF